MDLPEANAWLVIVGGVVTVLGTVTASIVAIITAVKIGKVQTQQAVVAEKVDTVQKQQSVVEGKVDTVHELTNSRLSRVEEKLTATEGKLSMALDALREERETRVTLAQEAARELERRGLGIGLPPEETQ